MGYGKRKFIVQIENHQNLQLQKSLILSGKRLKLILTKFKLRLPLEPGQEIRQPNLNRALPPNAVLPGWSIGPRRGEWEREANCVWARAVKGKLAGKK